jgi:hypothetical protein
MLATGLASMGERLRRGISKATLSRLPTALRPGIDFVNLQGEIAVNITRGCLDPWYYFLR